MRQAPALALAVTLLFASACAESTSPSKTIRIAGAFPVSERPANAEAVDNATRFAVERARIPGYRLEYVSFDDALAGQFDTTKAMQNLQAMVAEPTILGMVGPYNSNIAAQEIPVANRAPLAMVSPSATLDCLTVTVGGCTSPERPTGANNFFRVAAPDRLQGAAMAEYAFAKLGLRSVAVLTSSGGPFALAGGVFQRTADEFAARFTALGGTVTDRTTFPAFTEDFTPLLHRLREHGATGVYAASISRFNTCRIPTQMAGIFPVDGVFMGFDGIWDADCVKELGPNAAAVYATVAEPGIRDSAAARRVVNEFRARYPKQDIPYAFAAYDAASVLIDAIGRAVEAGKGAMPARAAVVSAVAATHGVEGVTGVWSFDANGDATAPGVSYVRVSGGQWKMVGSMNVQTRA